MFRVVIVALTMAVPISARAQAPGPVRVGLQGGVNFSTVTFTKFNLPHKARFGPVGGVFVKNEVARPLYLQADAVITTRGVHVTFPNGQGTYGFTYLDVSLFAGWARPPGRGPQFHLFVGPSIGVKIAEVFSIGGDKQEAAELSNGHDYGFTLGGGWDFHRNLEICVRARFGGSNILRTEIVGNSQGRNRTLQVTFGIQWPK